jgi:biotin carboxylase
MRTLERVLVANRGEIALRIMRTVRRMGLSTVAVFSDADANTPAVRFADTAVRLGGAASKDSYLKVEAILDAAKKTGADAIHPLRLLVREPRLRAGRPRCGPRLHRPHARGHSRHGAQA